MVWSDTLACRLVARVAVHAYEVDLPANIDYKRAGMRATYGLILPKWLDENHKERMLCQTFTFPIIPHESAGVD